MKVKESGLHNGNFAVTYTPTADGVYTLDLTILNRKFATHMFTVSDSMFDKNCGPEKTEKEEESTRVIQPVIKPQFPRQGTYRVAWKHLIVAFEIKT